MTSKSRRIIIGVALVCLGLILSISSYSLYAIHQRAIGQHFSDPPSVLKLSNNQLLADSLRPKPSPPLLYADNLSLDGFRQPAKTYRPWTRWWWPGNLVSPLILQREIQRLDSIGFGGVEIQAFAAGAGELTEEEQIVLNSVQSPAFYGNLQRALDYLDDSSQFKLDLMIGSGWPSGGPHINLNDNLQSLFWGEAHILGGKQIDIPVPPAEIPNGYFISAWVEGELEQDLMGFHRDALRLICLIAAKPRAGKRSLDPLDLSDQVSLDPDSLFVLTDLVNDQNQLNWQAPKGYWKIIAVYAGPNGERPALSATADPGYVVNPIDSGRIVAHLNNLFKTQKGVKRLPQSAIRAIFSDSYEYKAERIFDNHLPKEFAKRRGYDLEAYYPAIAVPDADNFIHDLLRWPRASRYALTEADERIRYDYQKTLSELIIENNIASSRDWAEANGWYFKAQTYGSKIDIIKAAGQSHIPEVDQSYAGGSKLFLKLVSSGGHLYDRPLISAEAFVHHDKDYTLSPQKLKVAADKLFLAGINQLVYHGTPYPWQKEDFGTEAWQPFSSPSSNLGTFSGNFSKANTLWPHLGAFNQYVSRCQYLLQQGKPQTEALVYYPFLGFPTTFDQINDYNELYFNGDLPPWDESPLSREGISIAGQGDKAPIPHEAWYKKTATMLEMLENQGINWDWVNDDALLTASWENGYWQIGQQQYSYLILSHAPHIGLETIQHLDSLVDLGAPMVIYGDPPKAQAGFYDYLNRDPIIANITQERQAGRELKNPADLRNHLQRIRVERPLRFAGSYPFLRYQLRELDQGAFISFLANQSSEERYFRLQLPSRIQYAYWLDPENGKIYAADYQAEQDLLGFLPAFGSMFLFFSEQAFFEEDSLDTGNPLSFFLAQSSRTILHELQNWQLMVPNIKTSKTGRFELKDSVFFDWRTEPQLRFVAEEGRYLAEFFLQDTLEGFRYILDLGELYQSAEVYLNTESLGRLSYRPFVIECTHKLKPGWNAIEIWLSPSPRNAMIFKAQKGDKRYRQFTDKEWSLQAAGLLGPVRLLEVFPEGRRPTP